jgi:hypothetical protein
LIVKKKCARKKIPIEDGKYYQKYISHGAVKETADLA